MPVDQMNAATISDTVNRLIGTGTRAVKLGHGSFLTLDLTGNTGDWHLWIYGAAWRIDSATEILAGSEDDRDTLETAVRAIEGRVLTAVSVSGPSLGLELVFDEVALRVFPIHSTDMNHWLLYTPPGPVLVAGPGTSWEWTE
ncbi:hypothetical protein [Longispora fulva]|uniref:Uncharacterized protein n=1 Tax=Longispora fulva TaxID=619741 RepID=A0A8J7GW32_9ACTN|nr:hypothetical protein [Longispora fulva]MBG6138601.1 hypothetical protein [Longispora fulva]